MAEAAKISSKRQIAISRLKAEFKKLTKMGTSFAKKTGIKTAEDVAEIIHKHRGLKNRKVYK